MRENIFLTLGSPLVDIIANVDQNFLDKYDLKPNNAVAAKASNKSLFVEIEQFQPKYVAGGCSLNAARTLQMSLKIPKTAIVIGAIGKDIHGTVLKKQLETENVNYIFEEVDDFNTGKCAVLITHDNRSLCTDLGASSCFKYAHIKSDSFWTAVENAQFYYVPGFFLRISLESILAIAEHSLVQGKIFTFNLSAPFLSQMYENEMIKLMPFVDILFGNESEARTFAKVHKCSSENINQILLFINDFYKLNTSRPRITVITRGPNSVYLVRQGVVSDFPVSNIQNIIDTSSAGDAFVGGFMAEYIKESLLSDCVLNGIKVAGEVIQNIGCNFKLK